jgi:hypothetical protein
MWPVRCKIVDVPAADAAVVWMTRSVPSGLRGKAGRAIDRCAEDIAAPFATLSVVQAAA